MTAKPLSDKAIAVFAFAAYHQLSSGEAVSDVVLHDGAGHAADPEAIEELEAGNLARTSNGRAVLTEDGRLRLGRMIEAMRSAA